MHRSLGWALSSVVEGPGYSVKVQFHIVHAIFSLSMSNIFHEWFNVQMWRSMLYFFPGNWVEGISKLWSLRVTSQTIAASFTHCPKLTRLWLLGVPTCLSQSRLVLTTNYPFFASLVQWNALSKMMLVSPGKMGIAGPRFHFQRPHELRIYIFHQLINTKSISQNYRMRWDRILEVFQCKHLLYNIY